MQREELLTNLSEMLCDLFRQHQRGVASAKINRAHGYIDGYMRVVVDCNFATKAELLKLVYEARASATLRSGPHEAATVAPSRPSASVFQAA